MRVRILSADEHELVRRGIAAQIPQRPKWKVVAEGVETAKQLERIRALDCDQWQEYCCCPPLPAPELAARIANDAAISAIGLQAALTRASRLLGP